MSIWRVVKKINSILTKDQRRKIGQLTFLMIIGGILETFSMTLILPFVDAVMDPDKIMNYAFVVRICSLFGINEARELMLVLAICLALLYIAKNAYLLFEYNIHYKFVYDNMFTMQKRLLNTLIHRPYEYFLGISSGEVTRIIGADTSGTFQLLISMLSMLTEIIVSVMLVGTIFVIAPLVTVTVCVVLLSLLLFINAFIKPKMRKAGKNQQVASAGMTKWLLQSIQGIKELKVMSKEEYFQENYSIYGNRYVNSLRKNQVLALLPKYIIEGLSMSVFFGVIAVFLYKGSINETFIPLISVVAMAALRILPSVNRISISLAQISYSEPMLDKLIENLQTISNRKDVSLGMDFNQSNEQQVKGKNFPILSDSIEMHDVSFSYPGSSVNVLNCVNMRIKCGESIGVVGPSGSGKSTTADLILGLLEPKQGKVLVDGININDNMQEWHSQIGYIPQTIFMLDDTVRSNIAFGVDEGDVSEDQIWKSLKDASLDNFIKSLPEGLDTEIGERGVRLSGGQRQRIGIARALYTNARVLVFDEATSALDSETESAIMESINQLKGRITMIIIAHRTSTLESCDHIYEVKNGDVLRIK